ncbi:MAG TPA: hypothetical protein VF618_19205 [Thermoanaerobaculia bacterium]
MKCTVRIAALCLLLLAALTPADASILKNLERGIAPDQMYQFGDLDHVNLFNGNLVVTLPMGPRYPVDGGLTYGLVLSYNSTVWEWQEVTTAPPQGHLEEYNVPWSTPTRRSNAGFGWTLSLGRVFDSDIDPYYQQMVFESPDGHNASLIGSASGPFRVSADGSFVRFKNGPQEVETPDGTKRQFALDAALQEKNGYGWLTGLQDVFGNGLQVQQVFNGPSGRLSEWIITDTLQRVHHVYFKNFAGVDYSMPTGTAQSNYRTVVDRIVFQDTATRSLTYEFIYANDAGVVDAATLVEGGCRGNAAGWPSSYNLPVLREVRLPDGTSFKFQYSTPGTKTSCTSGLLTTMVLPTQGRVEWAYGGYQFPSVAAGCKDGASWRSGNTGVVQRQFKSPLGADLGKWTYSPVLESSIHLQCLSSTPTPMLPVFQELVNTVVRPDNSKDVYHFSVMPGLPPDVGTASIISASEYGSPQVRLHLDSTGLRALSSEHYDCSAGTCPGTPARQRFIRYVYDGTTFHPTTGQVLSVSNSDNPRIESERTLFVNDGNRFIDTNRSDYDGFGHFRRSTVENSFDPAGSPVRMSYVNYNPGTNALGFRNGVYAFSATDKWILNTYDFQWTRQGNAIGETRSWFDGNGSLRRRRSLAKIGDGQRPAPAATDVVVEYVFDGVGNLRRERYYGGDSAGQALGTGALDSLTLPAVPSYDIRHDYSSGTRVKSAYYARRTTAPFDEYEVVDTLNLTVSGGGLPISSRDPAGLETTYTYNTAGELTTIAPPAGLAATTITYQDALASGGSFTPAQVGVDRHDTSARYFYDSLGRLWREAQRMPNGTWSVRETLYDGMGRKWKVSEPTEVVNTADIVTAPAGAQTVFTYDAFGRVRSMTKPDGKVITNSYAGVREVTRTTPIGAASDTATVVESYDAAGRLIAVTEPSGLSSAYVTTTYAYDHADRLSEVRLPMASGIAQTRLFAYDGRGFLDSESHPESGTTFYRNYDARGHARDKLTSNLALNLRFTYDEAERLTRIDAPWPVSGSGGVRPMKEFVFGAANETGNLVRGKLKSATRYNYAPDDYAEAQINPEYTSEFGTIRLREDYIYEAAPLRTTRDTTLETGFNGSFGWVRTVSTAVKYDQLGLPAEIVYPSCWNCAFSSGSLVPGYSRGRTSTLDVVPFTGSSAPVKRVLKDVSYWPNFMTKDVTHGNDIVDHQEVASMARPVSISFGNSSPCAAPTVTQQPLSQTIQPGGTANLSIAATGTGTLQYEWHSTSNLPLVLGTGNTFAASPSQTTTYLVFVKNDCTTTWSEYFTVTVGSCDVPTILNQSTNVTINPGQSATLMADAAGTGPHTFQWYEGAVGSTATPMGYNQGTLTVTAPEYASFYWVRVSNACGSVDSAQMRVSVRVAAGLIGHPLTATRTAANAITITWQPIAGAHHYQLERRTGGAGFQLVPMNPPLTGTSYVDTDVPAGVVYAYRVRAVDVNDSNDTASPYTNVDVATTLTFTNVQPGQFISAGHFAELLMTVNAARATNGWPAATWTQILPANVPAPASGAVIAAVHMEALRRQLYEALSGLGVPSLPFTTSPLDPRVHAIQAWHVTEMQQRVQ